MVSVGKVSTPRMGTIPPGGEASALLQSNSDDPSDRSWVDLGASPPTKIFRSGYWHDNRVTSRALTTGSVGLFTYYTSWYCPAPVTINALGLTVTTAATGGQFNLGLNVADSWLQPGRLLTLVSLSPTVLGFGSSGTVVVTIRPGWYFWALGISSGVDSPVIRVRSPFDNFSMNNWFSDTLGGSTINTVTYTGVYTSEGSGFPISSPTVNVKAVSILPAVWFRAA